jgi:hypothetical protein
MDSIYNSQGVRVPGMFKKGGSAPKGYHFMPDGRLMNSCYYKAKAAHKVFPSAYASGMIAKCRKKKAGK